MVHRELVLLTVLIGITVAAFFLTRGIAHGNEVLRRRQAAAWYALARQASSEDRPDKAVAALRRAVAKDRENRQHRLALADALAAASLQNEARRELRALRDAEPEDPEANLRLARLEARGSDTDAARRYYQTALSSLWRPGQTEERRRVRTELIEFLLAHAESARALSELLLLEVNLPDDATTHVRVGRMFTAAGDSRLALNRFVHAVRLEPDNTAALTAAGEAAFALGDYRSALGYLRGAARDNVHAGELHELAQLVLDNDPLAPRLGLSERRRRALRVLQEALSRVETCPDTAQATHSALATFRTDAAELQTALKRMPRDDLPDAVEDSVDLVYRIERTAERICGTPPGLLDRALVLIGRRHLEAQ